MIGYAFLGDILWMQNISLQLQGFNPVSLLAYNVYNQIVCKYVKVKVVVKAFTVEKKKKTAEELIFAFKIF